MERRCKTRKGVEGYICSRVLEYEVTSPRSKVDVYKLKRALAWTDARIRASLRAAPRVRDRGVLECEKYPGTPLRTSQASLVPTTFFHFDPAPPFVKSPSWIAHTPVSLAPSTPSPPAGPTSWSVLPGRAGPVFFAAWARLTLVPPVLFRYKNKLKTSRSYLKSLISGITPDSQRDLP